VTPLPLRDGYTLAPPGPGHKFCSLYHEGTRVALLNTQTLTIRQRRDVAIPAWAMLELLRAGGAKTSTEQEER